MGNVVIAGYPARSVIPASQLITDPCKVGRLGRYVRMHGITGAAKIAAGDPSKYEEMRAFFAKPEIGVVNLTQVPADQLPALAELMKEHFQVDF